MSLGGAAEQHTPVLAPGDRFGLRHAALWLDRAIGMLTEGVGAVIVVAETCILFAGVVSRYVFDNPLIWTDELGNFLFLWLVMLGTVVALRADSHMRLTTVVNWVRPDLGRWFSSVGALVVVAFVLLVLMPALTYVDEQQYTELTT
ncbi:MAG: TRAP transporter small permease subunit, partial [Acetobacteraceae bacterium]